MNKFDVRIDRLFYGGDAIGRLANGRTVFVPFAIPGEMVRLRLIEEKARYARVELVEVLEPSPKRITARCCHFTHCGGCHYQYLNYPNQLSGKSTILLEQLKRIGGLIDIPAVEIAAASKGGIGKKNCGRYIVSRSLIPDIYLL